MPSEPIPISTSPPQQPFGGSAVGMSANANSLFGKWTAFSPAKANNSPPGGKLPNPIDHHNEHHDSFEHDSLEFGDISDLKARGWAAAAAARGQRRAVSMSVSPSQTSAMYQNGVTMSPPQPSILTDKMARGQGVLRRLSLSNGFTRQQPTVPPPVPGPPNPTPIGSLPAQQPGLLAAHPPAQPEGGAQVNRAGTIAGSRRRFSESTARRRGVSPMGERILRDHF